MNLVFSLVAASCALDVAYMLGRLLARFAGVPSFWALSLPLALVFAALAKITSKP